MLSVPLMCHMPSIERKLQRSLNRLGRWCDENGCKFSPTKTMCSLLSTTEITVKSSTLSNSLTYPFHPHVGHKVTMSFLHLLRGLERSLELPPKSELYRTVRL